MHSHINMHRAKTHRHAHTSTCPFLIFRFLVCRPFTQRVTVVLLRVHMHRCLHVPDQISLFPLGRRKACVIRPLSLCHGKAVFPYALHLSCLCKPTSKDVETEIHDARHQTSSCFLAFLLLWTDIAKYVR